MKLNHAIIFMIFLLSLTPSHSQDSICNFDTNRFVELLHTGFPYKTYDTISFAERSRLTESERCTVQKLLVALFTKNRDSLLYEYSDYKFQLVSAIDSNGRKYVWVNGICNPYLQHSSRDWRRSIITTADGGECFFHGLINLNRGKIIYIIFNGEARIKKLNRDQDVQECDATEAK